MSGACEYCFCPLIAVPFLAFRVPCSTRPYCSVIVIDVIVTGCTGRSFGPVCTLAIFETTSCPDDTLPKRLYFGGRVVQFCPSQMKNCDPLVFGPEFAIARLPIS